LTQTETEVSFVLRDTVPVRLAAISAIWLLHREIRAFLIRQAVKYPELQRQKTTPFAIGIHALT
jgi:hypothetical protein